jgi:hypothetical protein
MRLARKWRRKKNNTGETTTNKQTKPSKVKPVQKEKKRETVSCKVLEL